MKILKPDICSRWVAANLPRMVVAIPIVICFVGALSLYVKPSLSGKHRYLAAIKELRESKTPLTMMGLENYRRDELTSETSELLLPILRPVFSYYQEASALGLPGIGGVIEELDVDLLESNLAAPRRREWSREQATADFLERVRPWIRELETVLTQHPLPIQLLKKNHNQFEHWKLCFAYSVALKQVSSIVEIDCAYALHSQDFDEARRSCLLLQTIGNAIPVGYASTGFETYIDLKRSAMERVRDGLAYRAWSESDLDAWQRELASQASKVGNHWNDSLAMDLIERREFLEYIRDPCIPLDKLSFSDSERSFFHQCRISGQSFYLEEAELIEGILKDTVNPKDHPVESILERLDRDFARARKSSDRAQLSVLEYLWFSRFRLRETLKAYELERRFTRAALAIKQFQLQEGRWPQHVEELATIWLSKKDWDDMTVEVFERAMDKSIDHLLIRTRNWHDSQSSSSTTNQSSTSAGIPYAEFIRGLRLTFPTDDKQAYLFARIR